MKAKKEIISDSREFFDLKNDLLTELQNLEASVYSQSSVLDSIESKLNKLESYIQKYDNDYFRIKLHSAKLQFSKLKKRKGYRKLEFDRLFRLVSLIKESDSVEFLNEAIKNRIEKIANGYTESKLKIAKTNLEIPKESYFIFTFQKIYFIVKKYPKRLLKKVPFTRTHVRFLEERFPIFPIQPFEKDELESVSHLLILRKGVDLLCLRYNTLEAEIDISEEDFAYKLRDLEKPTEIIKRYFRWRGNNCYLIEFL